MNGLCTDLSTHLKMVCTFVNRYAPAGNKLEGDLGEIVSQQGQTSPCFQGREKLKCVDQIGKIQIHRSWISTFLKTVHMWIVCKFMDFSDYLNLNIMETFPYKSNPRFAPNI